MRYDDPIDLLAVTVQTLYSAETQLILALPRVVMRADHPSLRSSLQSHLDETKSQAARLERIADLLGVPCSGRKCLAMDGLLKDGAELMGAGGDESLTDSAIIAACQCVEHYELAAYDAAIAQASGCAPDEVVQLLRASRSEEEHAATALTHIVSKLRALNSSGSPGNTPR